MRQAPRDLSVPELGSQTTRKVLGEYLKRVLADLRRIPAARFDSRVASDFERVRAWLERLLARGGAGPVFAALRQVSVSTLVRCIDRELWGGGDVTKLDAWLCELSALLAFEFGRAGALPEGGLGLHRAPRRIVCPRARLVVELPEGCRLSVQGHELAIEHATSRARLDLSALDAAPLVPMPGVRVERPYYAIVDEVVLATADNNPLSEFEAHPQKQGNAIDLGGHAPERWTAALGEAFGRVERYLPELAAEMRLALQLVVPVGYDAERHLSASYAEAIGLAYLSLHPDPMTMTEALIHEFSHNKLNALARLDPLLHNAFHPLYASPVRPDPRPLYGVLLAVHAFTPVARLYELMREARDPLADTPAFARRFAAIVAGNHEGMATLVEHAKTTPVGAEVLGELARWDEHFGRAGLR